MLNFDVSSVALFNPALYLHNKQSVDNLYLSLIKDNNNNDK